MKEVLLIWSHCVTGEKFHTQKKGVYGQTEGRVILLFSASANQVAALIVPRHWSINTFWGDILLALSGRTPVRLSLRSHLSLHKLCTGSWQFSLHKEWNIKMVHNAARLKAEVVVTVHSVWYRLSLISPPTSWDDLSRKWHRTLNSLH